MKNSQQTAKMTTKITNFEENKAKKIFVEGFTFSSLFIFIGFYYIDTNF